MLSKPIRVCSCSLLWKTGYDRYSICVRERLQLDLIKIICSILTFSGQRNLQALAKTHMKMSACQLITTKARGVHRCESITLPCWWHKFDGNLRKWIRRIKLRAVWMGILSCVESFGSLPLGLHLSLAVDKKRGAWQQSALPSLLSGVLKQHTLNAHDELAALCTAQITVLFIWPMPPFEEHDAVSRILKSQKYN